MVKRLKRAGKAHRRRRHPLLRALLLTVTACVALALAGPVLYDTPLYPLSAIAGMAIEGVCDTVRGVASSLADAAYDSGRSKPEGQTYTLTLLVNRWNPLPDDLRVELCDIGEGKQVDVRCRDELLDLLADCRSAGLSPVIRSAYRTDSYQSSLYENKVRRLQAEGLSDSEARAEAMTVVALPGTSEHQTGLALDIVDAGYQELDEAQENTPVQQWLMRNSWRYGFILRYPTGKSNITGIIYEPWHYRYVGCDAARAIYESGLCLEEYLERR